MTDEVNALISRLKKQAKMYEGIDRGTGFGWDKDAKNIRDAIKLISKFEKAWNELEVSIRSSCEDTELMKTTSRVANLLKVEANILRYMRNIGSDIFGDDESLSEDKNIETKKSEVIEANGCL